LAEALHGGNGVPCLLPLEKGDESPFVELLQVEVP
jgi:hypothetical protein